jgi:YegS/Rv2252/BmrU family lipid kinase
MKRKFLFFINPISGTTNKKRVVDQIINTCKKRNVDFEIMHTNAEGDYAFLGEKISAEKITDVVICGGDGTVSAVTSFLIGSEINVGIVPQGSGNGLALAAGISRNTNQALEKIFKGESAWIDGFFINKKFSCMLSGLGFDAQVAHDFAQQKKRGLFTYIMLCFKHFFSSKNYLFNINVNGTRISEEALFVSVANSNQFGNKVTIAPKASLNDGLLDLIVVKKTNRFLSAFYLVKHILLGKIQDEVSMMRSSNKIIYLQSATLQIENPQKAPLHIDGEPVDTSDYIEINIVPNAFKLLQ